MHLPTKAKIREREQVFYNLLPVLFYVTGVSAVLSVVLYRDTEGIDLALREPLRVILPLTVDSDVRRIHPFVARRTRFSV